MIYVIANIFCLISIVIGILFKNIYCLNIAKTYILIEFVTNIILIFLSIIVNNREINKNNAQVINIIVYSLMCIILGTFGFIFYSVIVFLNLIISISIEK